MKFSIPHASDSAEAERVLQAIARFVNAPVPEQRIFRMTYVHNRHEFSVEVGKPMPAYYQEVRNQ